MILKFKNKFNIDFFSITPLSIMKITLAVSLVSHLLLILGMNTLYPNHWKSTELKTYRVDFLRMEVEDLPEGEAAKNVFDDTDIDEPLIHDTEDTISLDTKDERYISYTTAVKNEIMKHWRFPPEARAYRMEGSSTIIFTILRQGNTDTITVTKSSGHEILDNEAIRAIRNSSPFPSFPSSIKVQRLNIIASFEYRLKSSKDTE